MGFLQRSKSEAPTGRRHRKKDSKTPLPGQVPANTSVEDKRSSSFERPKTADASFSRPRTANAAIGRTSDWNPPSFKIDIKSENEVFSFPMPSPRVQASDDGLITKKRPSPLQELGSPAIGVAIGSPSQAPTQARPAWGRSITADSVSPRMPAQPPPTRAAPAIPKDLDFEILSTDVLKKRKSAWKSIGGLFCRRQTMVHVEEPVYRLKMPNAIEERDILIPDLAELAEYGSTPTYGPRSSSLLSVHLVDGRMQVDNAMLKPAGLALVTRTPSPVQKESFSPMFRTINGLSEDKEYPDDVRNDSPLSVTSPNSFQLDQKPIEDINAPQLAILDLPDPKFDRYSVMFEKFLLSTDSNPSLLERRQSKLQRTRSIKKLDLFPNINDRQTIPRLEINGIPQQQPKLSSPTRSKSLTARLGKKVLSPVAEAFTTALNRPHPIRRSKTAPSQTTSPGSPNFPTTPRIEVQTVETIVQCASPASFCGSVEYSLPPTPMTFTTISDSGSAEVIEMCELAASELEPAAAEPNWDMMVPKPLQIKSEKRVVHVSVARQVSVNGSLAAREEKQEPTANDGKPSRNAAAAAASGGARQPLRARMVELGKNLNNRTSAAMLIQIAEE